MKNLVGLLCLVSSLGLNAYADSVGVYLPQSVSVRLISINAVEPYPDNNMAIDASGDLVIIDPEVKVGKKHYNLGYVDAKESGMGYCHFFEGYELQRYQIETIAYSTVSLYPDSSINNFSEAAMRGNPYISMIKCRKKEQ